MKYRAFSLALLLLAARPALAQTPKGDPTDYATARFERVIRAQRIAVPMTIDGRLTEPSWETAQPATNFIEWEPNPGQPAADQTEVRILYDNENLYVGARCFDDDPENLTVTELKEDFTGVQSDLFAVFIDSLHDRQSGFYFGTNPAGARRDIQAFNDGDASNQDWDGVWDVKSTIDEQGWVAEFVIPFKTLRFVNAAEVEFGINFLRRVRRTNTDSDWAPIPRRYRIMRASMAGTLTGLQNIEQGRNLKIKPYLISSIAELGSGVAARRDYDGDAGLDLKYGITRSMTLDMTYRTEFSQVEVDQQQVNLTRFNLFFPEKREFFLENTGIFAVAGGGAGGGGSDVIPFFSRRIGLSPAGTPIPIAGGARVSGRTGSYDIGVLAMRTQDEGAIPATNFLVGRLRKTFRGTSTAGAIVTSRDSTTAGDFNRLVGVDAQLRFFEKLDLLSYLMRTETPGITGRDQARLIGAQWRDNDFTLGGRFEQVQSNFNPEVGFVRRKAMAHYSTDVSWRPRPRNNTVIRNYTVTGSADHYDDEQGNVETRQQSVGPGILFQNSSEIELTVTNTFDRLVEPFNIRTNVAIPPGNYSYVRYAVSYRSDLSRAVSGSASIGTGEFWDGRSHSFSGTLSLKPNYHLNVDFNLSRDDVTLPEGAFVTTLVGARVLYAFTPKTFLHSFLQYNAAAAQFSANTRFNIIHRPLSDLYVVYNERRDTRRGVALERAFIVKFTNLFDF